MFLLSRHSGWGRGLWQEIKDGTVTVRGPDTQLRAVVCRGQVIEQVQRSGNRRRIMRYGQGLTIRQGNKVVEQVFFQPGSVQAIRRGGLWKKEMGLKLCGARGTLRCYSTSGGAYGREVFTYDNGVRAYAAARGQKRLEVYRPDGRLWIVLEGQVRPHFHPVARRLNLEAEDLGSWSFMMGPDLSVTVYGPGGTSVVTRGRMENRQREGRWLQNGRVSYYLSGVRVSRELCEEDPDQWDGQEVLRIPNAQVRSSFLNRMGYERLLKKVEHKVIDTDADGSQLLAVVVTSDPYPPPGIDRVMQLLRVVCPSTGATYVLRVPPNVQNCEQARHWTFGLDLESVRKGARLHLLRET